MTDVPDAASGGRFALMQLYPNVPNGVPIAPYYFVNEGEFFRACIYVR